MRGLTGSGYCAVADVIRSLPDDIRLRVAHHFASEFNHRYPGFDPGHWNKATGGIVQPGLPPSEIARQERVAAYKQQRIDRTSASPDARGA